MGSPDVTRVGKHIIEQNRDSLKSSVLSYHLKRNLKVLADIVVVITIYSLSFIDAGIKMLHSLKQAPKDLAEYSIANIRQLFNRLLQLTATGVGEDINTVKFILQETRMGSPDVTRGTEKLPSEPVLSRTAALMNRAHNRSLLLKEKETTFVQEFKKKGITVTYFDDLDGTKSRKERNEMFPAILGMSNLFNQPLVILCEQNKTYIVDRPNSRRNAYSTAKLPSLRSLSKFSASLNIALARLMTNRSQSRYSALLQAQPHLEQQTIESEQHTMNVTIIAANRSFLIEEINTMALVRAFQDQGITCFDGLDGTLGEQQRAEGFLTILEEKNLVDQLLVILRKEGMKYVLDRLNNCRNAYSADPQILRRNIFNNRTDILDNLDIDDVREIFIERGVFSSRMFDEIEKKCSESKNQMNAVLNKIKTSGPRAMRTLVDVLYISHSDSLADSLLMGTPNELQEIQDNTQID